MVPATLTAPAHAAVQRFHADHVLGTSMAFVVVGADEAAAGRAFAAARAEIERLDAVLSGWRPDSELARLNGTIGPTPVSHDLYQVIDACEAWRTRSGGRFSGRLGDVEALWRSGEAAGTTPDAAVLAATAARAATADVRLDPATRSIDPAGVTFAVDALAKGYIIDAALRGAALAAPEASGLMLDIGGDLRCRGQAPDVGGWRIGLTDGRTADNVRPKAVITVADMAAATSGPGARDRLVGGEAYGHTLSPETGQPVPPATVSVVARSALDADALATALGTMPAAAGLALAEGFPGAEARLLGPDGRITRTSGWDRLLVPAVLSGPAGGPSPARMMRVAAPAGTAAWPSGFEVDIDYTIPDLAYGRYRPPFVVIWITDERGALVRTLFHLGTRPRRYLDSNYIWFKAFEAASDADVSTVTRPSRQPGRYTAVWDGRDDHGAFVPQGRYTINIEASREHAGHSYQTIPLDLGRRPGVRLGRRPGRGRARRGPLWPGRPVRRRRHMSEPVGRRAMKDRPPGAGFDRGAFYRLCRMLHGYLSAFAFLALIFFCATGVLLNHPEWFERYKPAERTATAMLTPAELAAAKAAKEPGPVLAAALAARTPLRGAYASSDLADGRALIRLEGPKGSTDIDVDLTTGRAEAKVTTADFAAVIQDLHRGKNSGGPWRFVIDFSAYLLLALSVIGYVLFFSLKFRLRTSLLLTAASLIALVAVAAWLVS